MFKSFMWLLVVLCAVLTVFYAQLGYAYVTEGYGLIPWISVPVAVAMCLCGLFCYSKARS